MSILQVDFVHINLHGFATQVKQAHRFNPDFINQLMDHLNRDCFAILRFQMSHGATFYHITRGVFKSINIFESLPNGCDLILLKCMRLNEKISNDFFFCQFLYELWWSQCTAVHSFKFCKQFHRMLELVGLIDVSMCIYEYVWHC